MEISPLVLQLVIALVLILESLCSTIHRPEFFKECVGFGCEATRHNEHVETCLADVTEKSLRKCVKKKYVHVKFKKSGTIHLESRLDCKRGLILDGSGQDVTISGYGLKLNVDNILYRIRIADGDGLLEENDAILMKGNYRNIWIHKCTFTNFLDALINIEKGMARVTISYNEFHHHDRVIHIATTLEDSSVNKITLHHNYFHDNRQAQPRIRYAYVHMYNNVIENWTSYGTSYSTTAKVLLENNYYVSKIKPHRAVINNTRTREDKRESINPVYYEYVSKIPKEGYIKSIGNFFGEGSKDVKQFHPEHVLPVRYIQGYTAEESGQKLYERVKREAGYKGETEQIPVEIEDD